MIITKEFFLFGCAGGCWTLILRYISIFRTSLWTRAKRGLRVFVSDQGRGDHSAVHGAQHH